VVGALGVEFFARPAREVAPEMIGCLLAYGGVTGTIIEVERYEQWDAASHSFRGARGRAQTMFGPPGRLYVYRSYGLHWCANVVCEAAGAGSAILIRAVIPASGVALMESRRRTTVRRDLCRGPGRVTQAFGITGALDGAVLDGDVDAGGVRICAPANPPGSVVRSRRIGITRDANRLWRYSLEGSTWVSGPRLPAVRDMTAAAA
jgi:DNA-3-methyladenine glycosylase